MKRFVRTIGTLALAASMAACAGDAKQDEATGVAGTTGTAGTSADVDRGWVQDQLAAGDAEVKLGRLAQERGGSADVRAYGALMVEKHTVAGTELKRIAERHNVAPKPEAKDDHNDLFEKLSKLSGEEFDLAYLEAMVDDHEDVIDALEKKAGRNDEHADVRDWATKTLPEAKLHLERAKDLLERRR